MEVSYGKLAKIMQEKKIKKKDIKEKAHLGWTTISKITNNQDVSMDVLKKICEYLECDIGDIVEFKKSEAKWYEFYKFSKIKKRKNVEYNY